MSTWTSFDVFLRFRPRRQRVYVCVQHLSSVLLIYEQLLCNSRTIHFVPFCFDPSLADTAGIQFCDAQHNKTSYLASVINDEL